MNECLTTPQHETRSAIGCQNKVEREKKREREINQWINKERKR